MDNSVEL